MAGGYKQFGPSYKTSDIVRLGYEGYLNGNHQISEALVAKVMKEVPSTGVYDTATGEKAEVNYELAGKIAAMKEDGVGLAGPGGEGAVGLFREDLHDMMNASFKATFYFRGGEYYIQNSRMGKVSSDGAKAEVPQFKVGDKLTTDGLGGLVPVTAKNVISDNGKFVEMPKNPTIVGVVTHVGGYAAGNMFQWAGEAANGGTYIGFIMYI